MCFLLANLLHGVVAAQPDLRSIFAVAGAWLLALLARSGSRIHKGERHGAVAISIIKNQFLKLFESPF